MHFAPLLTVGSVVSCSCATLRGGLERAAVQYYSSRFGVTPLSHAQYCSQVVHHCLEDACRKPLLGLLAHNMPGREVIGHHTPGSTCSDNVSQPIEHFSQIIHSLWGVFGYQRQIRSDERPFFVAHVAGVSFSFHTPFYRLAHNTL